MLYNIPVLHLYLILSVTVCFMKKVTIVGQLYFSFKKVTYLRNQVISQIGSPPA